MASRRCPVCGRLFVPRPQVQHQKICSTVECQRERKRRWQKDKRQRDPAYKADQREHAKAWAELHPNYWREYRATNPDYVERNRVQQKIRNAEHRGTTIAKMGESKPESPVPSGIYRLTPLDASGIAKMDAWMVEITLISCASDQPENTTG